MRDIVREFYSGPNKKGIRFGQFFVNRYVHPKFLPWPDLYYCEDTESAMEMALAFLRTGKKIEL
jgi:hypothetical protein